MVCHNCRSPRPPMPEGVTRPGKRSERRKLEREVLLAAKGLYHGPVQLTAGQSITERIMSIDNVDAKDFTE